MPYIHIARAPGRTLADYRRVQESMRGGVPPGHLLAAAGEAQGALHTVDVWDSKGSADRFAAEVLFPALQKTGLGPGPDATYIEFETDSLLLRGVER